MFVLNGKKILKLLLIIFILLFILTYITIKKNKGKTIQTISLPTSNKIVVLDAGHGNPDKRC